MKGSGKSAGEWKGWKGGKRPYIRVIVPLVLMAVVPVLVIELMSEAFLVQAMKDVQIHTLQKNSSVVSQYLNNFFLNQKKESQFIISNSSMRTLLQFEYQGQAEQMDWWSKEVQDTLQNSVTYGENINYGRLIDKDGCVVASSIPQQVGMDLAQTQMYRKIMEGEPQYIEMAMDKNGDYYLKLALPLLTDGEVTGIFEKGINFQEIENYLENKKKGRDCYMFLLDANWKLLGREQRKQVILPNGTCQNEFELHSLIKGISHSAGKESGVIHYQVYEKNITAVYQRIPSLNWYVISAMDETHFIDTIDALNLSVAFVGILVGGIAAWMGYRITGRSIKSYQLLSDAFASILVDPKEVAEIKICDLPETLDYVNQTRERVRTVQNRVRALENSDSLTGLYNRWGMECVFAEEFAGKKQKLAALLLDLDSITFLNQKRGVKVGTAIAGEIGRIVKKYVGENCVAGRMSNEEFLILYYDWDGKPDPEELAEQLRSDVEDITFLEQKRVFFTASIGLYVMKEGDHFGQIYEKCSEALFQAKQLDINRIVSYEEPEHPEGSDFETES